MTNNNYNDMQFVFFFGFKNISYLFFHFHVLTTFSRLPLFTFNTVADCYTWLNFIFVTFLLIETVFGEFLFNFVQLSRTYVTEFDKIREKKIETKKSQLI